MDENQVASTPDTLKQSEQKPARFAWFKTIFISICVSVLVSGMSVYIYDTYYAPKFLTVDFKGYVEQQRKLFLAKKNR